MSNNPQNPIFSVDPAALSACLPKIACVQCGTIIPLQCRRVECRLLCPSCGASHIAREQNGKWTARLLNESDDEQEAK